MEETEKKAESIYITEEELGTSYKEAPNYGPYRSAPAEESRSSAAQEMRVCPGCQRLISTKLIYCQACGCGPLKAKLPKDGEKSPGTAALLAILPALLGFFGIGHFYVERLGTGFLFLFAGFALVGAGIYCALNLDLMWVLVIGIAYIGLLVWQVFDAHAQAVEYNRMFED
jgi:TM2 domain-containing membrane protein YozV